MRLGQSHVRKKIWWIISKFINFESLYKLRISFAQPFAIILRLALFSDVLVTIATFIYHPHFTFNSLNASQLVTLHLGPTPTTVLCHVGDFGCGDDVWTTVMKIDGSKVLKCFRVGFYWWQIRNSHIQQDRTFHFKPDPPYRKGWVYI